MSFSAVLLQAAEGGTKAPAGGGGLQQLLVIGLIFIVFYFFMIRPQMKQRKEAKKFRENLQRNDAIITIGGIHGKIVDIFDDTVVITVEGGTKLRVEKSSVSVGVKDRMENQKK